MARGESNGESSSVQGREDSLAQTLRDMKGMVKLAKEFKKLNPPTFKGTSDPLEVENWLKEVNKSLELLGATDQQKVSMATYMLQGDADLWWEMVKRTRNVGQMTWAQFEEAFLGKFFPESTLNKKRLEFMHLIQRNLTVAEYEAKFSELARFEPSFMQNESLKAQQFYEGLRPTIKRRLLGLKLCTYADVVERALLVELDIGDTKQLKDQQGEKRKKRKPSNDPNKRQRTTLEDVQIVHAGNGDNNQQDGGKSSVCFNCHQVGHFRRKCPQLAQQQHQLQLDKLAEVQSPTLSTDMLGKGHMPPPQVRRPLPGHPTMHYSEPFGPGIHPSIGLFPFDGLPPGELREQKLASQHIEIETFTTENQELATSHSVLRQELAWTQQEMDRLQAHMGAIKSEKEQHINGLLNDIAKMEVDLQAVELVKQELQQARADAKSLSEARQELISRVHQLTQDLHRIRGDAQQIPALISELEGLRQECQHFRAAYDYEKKLHKDHLESLQVMEGTYISTRREVEKLQVELAEAERSGGPDGSKIVYEVNGALGRLPVGRGLYEDGHGISRGRRPSQGADAHYAGVMAGPSPSRSGYDGGRHGYDAARRATGYDAMRSGGYGILGGVNIYDAARVGTGFNAPPPRGASGPQVFVAPNNSASYGS